MKPKVLMAASLCYLIWGCNSLFWNLFTGPSPFFLLASRIIMSFVLTSAFLIVTGRGREIVALLRNREKMRFLIPAAIFICLDWGLYIWAVTAEHVIDCSLGYYLNPLVLFLFGLILFREKANRWETGAVVIACCGVLAYTLMAGVFPLLAVLFALMFPIYAMFKKYADADPIVSISVETMLLTPIALGYLLIFGRGAGGFPSLVPLDWPLLVGSGLVTAFPMVLYTHVVNELPMKLVGILEYCGTTIGMLCGVALGESMTGSKWVMLTFIVVGIIVFVIGSSKKKATPHT